MDFGVSGLVVVVCSCFEGSPGSDFECRLGLLRVSGSGLMGLGLGCRASCPRGLELEAWFNVSGFEL